ncbi:serine hydrolase domain-containing protein [Lacipirellula limnantheis]|uniref:D-alanyl-D-alanine carboxypeptidase n=1 Tax=Lacipirellula limnantheis TaxID=2528024 RepID=A0A517TWJ8_9BACT|nr:serine hydrolase domain-containing protein [Lacipirellula limnantheis]QDT72743.1 D-alanyl-D-alanine carboxypeptidase precursor [Lacipirellula limnantheis]
MDPDQLQQAWRAQSSQTRVTVDADLLRKEVERNQRDFGATILRRDAVEIGVALLLLPYWVYKGLTSSLPWTWWLTVPAILWVVGYFLADRRRYPQTPSSPGTPLLDCVKNSLGQIEHQIWLLRHVFWWYLLPFTISILAFFAHVSLQTSEGWLEAIGTGSLSFGFLIALYSFIDYINQRAVRTELEPRRRELLALLASLNGDDAAGELATTGEAERFGSSGVLRRWLVVAVATLVIYGILLMVAGGAPCSGYADAPRRSGPASDWLAKLIVDQRKEKQLVGLAAMVTVDGNVEAAAAHGERKVRSGVSVETSDRWHLGGISKSVTATMLARLVEAGKMKWTDTIGDAFPEDSVHEDWKSVTLQQLLTDTAGAPANFPRKIWAQHPALGPKCTEARREAVLDVLAENPASPPGEEYVYSNVGYTIAAAMAEQATGAHWEELVKQEVFDPLGLADSGFGPPESGDETLEQPRGHRVRLGGKAAAEDTEDNTPIIGPAATIHMSLPDLCTYAAEHLRGDLGEGEFLSAETYQLLHERDFGPYSSGWIRRLEGDEGHRYTVYWHNGSNTMWYAFVAFIPEMKLVVAVVANDGDSDAAEAAAWEIVKASVNQFDFLTDGRRGKSLEGAEPATP